MCFKIPIQTKGQTVEEIVAAHSIGMNDSQKAEYWWELTQTLFNLLGKVEDVLRTPLNANEWITAAQQQYPTLTEVKFADSTLYITDMASLQKIMTRDWTNIVPYVAEIGDCDKFATRLYSHLCDYYGLNGIVPVWGDTTGGYHGFNLAVLEDHGNLIARLIEPQTDAIFIEDGPLGKYVPRLTAKELGIKKL